MNKNLMIFIIAFLLCLSGPSGKVNLSSASTAGDYQAVPPFLTAGVPPLVMLVMGRNHKLYYEAYNDASDLNGDGDLDVGYNPDIDYYGYFDSYKCYTYSSANSRFEPSSTTETKKCSGADEWSGDLLNYLTMSRMDCLRKVLYGGHRSTDSTTTGSSSVVLERVFIPQDAHSWGKEYESIARDGYNITEYTPLDIPTTGTRHLFASTTLSSGGNPILRVLPNNTHRIWEWVAKEHPVCDNSLVTGGGGHPGHPSNHDEYDDLVLTYAVPAKLQGSAAPTNGRIDGSGNPFGADENYLTIFDGTIHVSYAGDYQFAVDGDDAVEVIIDGTVVAGYYGSHGKCTCTTYNGTINLSVGAHTIEFRHEEASGDDNYYLKWKGQDSGGAWQIVPSRHTLDTRYSGLDVIRSVYTLQTSGSTITDYVVRVVVCHESMPEANCKVYPSGTYKPVGILQRHGESERMYFGLISGSYSKNTSGGVLRKNIGAITDEIDPDTGQFNSTNGIIKTIDKFRISEFNYSTYEYIPGWTGAYLADRAMNEGEFPDWGNPIGEMMYEGIRYFAGKATQTSAFWAATMTEDNALGLPNASWVDPYNSSTGFDYCAKPFMLVISDINPTYDSDQLPGSYFNPSFTGDVTGLNVDTLADTICTEEGDTGLHYIGKKGSTYDGSCSPKDVTGFGDICGLCPEEPTKLGSYYSASVAYFGRTQDINPAQGSQNVNTYAVGLASPLPRIEIPVGDSTITLVPFAKSVSEVGGCLAGNIIPTQGSFQPTNTIVDFFVETITPTYGKFRINYEDVEQAADHDMDAIVMYEYQVNGNTVDITLNSTAAAGCVIQHMGYIISGTTADGTYLEVRDFDTATASDPDYFLDTPPGQGPGGTWADSAALPLTATRTFTAGSAPAATLLTNPLWYAAKWGGFEEPEGAGNNKPDLDSEWDKDLDGVPDTYFYVTNPLKLEEQLNKSFADILRRTSSGTAASVISNSRSGEGAIYQSTFLPEYKGPLGNTATWCGEVHALLVDAYGNMREDTNGNKQLDLADDKIIVFDGATVYKYGDDNGNSRIDGDEVTPDEIGTIMDINYLWSSSEWLNEISDSNVVSQRAYASTDDKRHIFTFIDANQNMVVDGGETVDFTCPTLPSVAELTDTSDIFPYIPVYPPFEASAPDYIETIRASQPSAFDDFLQNQTQRVINYIRGQDQGLFTSTTTPPYTIPAFRERKVDYDEDGTVEKWRLGDIVYSTPTFVGRPSEGYHLLYKDSSYAAFSDLYKNRRGVVYVGANDGMFHAFNAGFYNSTNYSFVKKLTTETEFELGAEMWAYVPYNLLPHLYWLTEPSYAHVYYCDQKPKIFDAKIFFQSDGTTQLDGYHPGGWGTVLVTGMRFGGGEIGADMDKTDGLGYTGSDRTMNSAFFIFDITNPELPPTLLAEISFDRLGFTTCYPAVIPMKDKSLITGDINGNDWYLVLGSGPAASDGTADSTALANATSDQPARLYIIDLIKLVTDKEMWTLNSSGTLTSGGNVFQEFTTDNNSFISDPISVDFNLDYNADVLYFGTVSGSEGTWGGKLRRVIIDNNLTTTTWTGDSTLIDLEPSPSGLSNGQPIVAAPSVALDVDGNRWVFFGTGRFFTRTDAANADQQSYYGIKEPGTWNNVLRSDLVDVTTAKVYEGGSLVENVATVSNWDELLIKSQSDKGWLIDFTVSKERNLGQSTLLGDILTFTTYIPSLDPCEFEGETYLYALYYLTGTAFYESVVGTVTEGGQEVVLGKVSLGKGLSITPNIHLGKEEGSKAFVQTSTGAIQTIDQINPGFTKSGLSSWREVD